jgi:hypothetical protein
MIRNAGMSVVQRCASFVQKATKYGSEQEWKASLRATAGREFNQYLEMTMDSDEIDPIAWWYDRRLIFPLLSRIAFKFLSVPSSSVGPERRFSTIGRIMEGRWRLHTDTIECLVMLKDYYCDPSFHELLGLIPQKAPMMIEVVGKKKKLDNSDQIEGE